LTNNAFIEKNFLYLFILSLMLHLVLATVIYNLPETKKSPANEPFMVDLQDLPESLKTPPDQRPVERLDEKRRRVPQEMTPRGVDSLDRLLPPRPAKAVPSQPTRQSPAVTPGPVGEVPVREAQPRRGEGLFRPPAPQPPIPSLSKLQPSSERMANMEETYRQKYRDEVAEGDAHFLNTNDLQFGSFLRRFESAVYGVWRYPTEAARLGIEGVTPVRITFNRQGEVEKIDLLESSGSRILDDEVVRTLKKVGRIGAFPKGYDKENFTLIAFFHYGITRGEGRSLR
jgi:protein TonB